MLRAIWREKCGIDWQAVARLDCLFNLCCPRDVACVNIIHHNVGRWISLGKSAARQLARLDYPELSELQHAAEVDSLRTLTLKEHQDGACH
jgi:hypothetical protein